MGPPLARVILLKVYSQPLFCVVGFVAIWYTGGRLFKEDSMSSKPKYERPMLVDFYQNQTGLGTCNPGSRDTNKGGCNPTGYSGGSCPGGNAVSANSCGTGNAGNTYYCSTGVTTRPHYPPCGTGGGLAGSQCITGGTTAECQTGHTVTPGY